MRHLSWLAPVMAVALLASAPILVMWLGHGTRGLPQILEMCALWAGVPLTLAGVVYLIADQVKFDSAASGQAWFRHPLLMGPAILVSAGLLLLLSVTVAGSLGARISPAHGHTVGVDVAMTGAWLIGLRAFGPAVDSPGLVRLESWCATYLRAWWLARLPFAVFLAVLPGHSVAFWIWPFLAALPGGRAALRRVFHATRPASDEAAVPAVTP